MGRDHRAIRSRRSVLGAAGSLGVTLLAGCSDEDRANEPDLSVDHPDAVQFDEPIPLTIDGLPDGTVEVSVEGEDRAGRAFSATATVDPDDERIELQTAPVVGGDVPSEIDVPVSVALVQFADISWQRYRPPSVEELTYRVRSDGDEVGSTTVVRHHREREQYADVAHDDLVGALYEPSGRRQGPGVLVLHGSDGDPMRTTAARLAQNGFTAVALRYFGGTGLPENLVEIPLEYVETAIEWLLDRETVSSDRIGLVGASKGGELALLAGSEFDDVGAVVSLAGSGVVWPGISDSPDPGSSWTLDGDPVTAVPYAEDGWNEDLRTGFENSLASADQSEIEAATIPVERIDGPVLLVSGTGDEIWPAERLHEIAADRLADRGGAPSDHRVYAGAGHVFVPRYLPTRGYTGGGTPRGNAEASHDHWPRVLETLAALE